MMIRFIVFFRLVHGKIKELGKKKVSVITDKRITEKGSKLD